MSTNTQTAEGTTTIEAVKDMPAIRMTRDFVATPAQLLRAHTDPELLVKWVGPKGTSMIIDQWDARTGGSWRYIDRAADGEEYAFHTVRDDRLVQTFTFEGRDGMLSSGMEVGANDGYAKSTSCSRTALSEESP